MWQFSPHKMPLKIVHKRQGIFAIVRRERRFFAYDGCNDEGTHKRARDWAVARALALHLVPNPYCTSETHVFMIYPKGSRFAVGCFDLTKKHILCRYAWTHQESTGFVQTHQPVRRGRVLQRRMSPLVEFTVPASFVSSIYAGRAPHVLDILRKGLRHLRTCLLRLYWRRWTRGCERYILAHILHHWRARCHGFVIVPRTLPSVAKSRSTDPLLPRLVPRA